MLHVTCEQRARAVVPELPNVSTRIAAWGPRTLLFLRLAEPPRIAESATPLRRSRPRAFERAPCEDRNHRAPVRLAGMDVGIDVRDAGSGQRLQLSRGALNSERRRLQLLLDGSCHDKATVSRDLSKKVNESEHTVGVRSIVCIEQPCHGRRRVAGRRPLPLRDPIRGAFEVAQGT